MATTIQIKRGTGSAVPSGLEDGELAINLDNGKLFFGSGSTSINSFRFENLTAENYIVSSSVTNITTQELSGSTNFGDSSDDTHTFTGAITASGNISASGNITAHSASFTGPVKISLATGGTAFEITEEDKDQKGRLLFEYDNGDPTLTIASRASTAKLHIRQDSGTNGLYFDEDGQIYVNNSTSDGVKIDGTSFSSIGTNTNALDLGKNNRPWKDLYLTGDGANIFFQDNTSGPELTLKYPANSNRLILSASDGHLSASFEVQGNISSSGVILSSNISSLTTTTGSILNSVDAISVTTGSILNSVDAISTVTGSYAITGSDVIFNHVTASGNISSSGEVKAASFRLGNGAFIIASNGNITTSNSLIAGNSPSGDTHTITGKTTLNGNITASGDISASGIIYASSFNNVVATNITASGNISASGAITASGFLGTTISAKRRNFTVPADTAGLHDGDAVYFGGTTSMTTGAIYHYKSDGTWELADADAVATSDGLLGVALGAASNTNGVLLRGTVTLGHDAGAIGDVLYLSTNPGSGSATAPSGTNDVVRIVGYKIFHASKKQVWFNPSSDFIIHA